MDPITQEITVEEVETSELSPAELSSLAEIVARQIKYHLAEIERLKMIKRRLVGETGEGEQGNG